MRKIAFSLIAASTLALGIATSDAEASTHKVQSGDSLWRIATTNHISVANLTKWNNLSSTIIYPNQVLKTSAQAGKAATAKKVKKVSTTSASSKKGTYKAKYNTNVRRDAGTKNRIVTLAKKGTTVTATHQKKVGSQVWYKVKANGKTGWMLSTLLKPATVKSKATAKAPAKSTKKAVAKATAKSGTYKTKYNSNVRTDAGTKNRIVTLARKGTTVTVSAQKKSGKVVWYKVKANGKTGWMSSALLVKSTKKATVKKASNSTSNASSSSVVNLAMSLRGIPYVYGGTTTRGFDCSGFVEYAFEKSGQKVPRTTLGQYASSKKVSNPEPGDLVFFAGTYRGGISHVGIYIGNNQFVHAGGRKSEVKSLNDSYWKAHFHSFRSL